MERMLRSIYYTHFFIKCNHFLSGVAKNCPCRWKTPPGGPYSTAGIRVYDTGWPSRKVT